MRKAARLSTSLLATVFAAVVLATGGGCSFRSTADLIAGARPDGGAGAAEVPPLVDGPASLDTSTTEVSVPAADSGPAEAPPLEMGPARDGGDVATAEVPPRGARVLLIIGDPMMLVESGDGVIQERLVNRGLDVTVHDDDQLAGLPLADAALVFVSPSVDAAKVGVMFTSVRKSVIVCEYLLFDEMGMVPENVANDQGVDAGEMSLEIISGGNPLAAGLGGTVPIAAAATNITWAVPAGAAVRVATIAAKPTRVAVFAWDTNAMMATQPAPARRVGLFLGRGTATMLTPQGAALFEAAVSWALPSPR